MKNCNIRREQTEIVNNIVMNKLFSSFVNYLFQSTFFFIKYIPAYQKCFTTILACDITDVDEKTSLRFDVINKDCTNYSF